MKRLLCIAVIFVSLQNSFAQRKRGTSFFTGSLNTTFGINENYTLDPDDGEMLLEPASFLFRAGIGHQFNRRWAISGNIGFDFHFKYDILAIPTYGSLRYNITEDAGDTFFVEASYGKLWRPAVRYSDGIYRKIGLGVQIKGDGRWNTIIRLDFHRKGILDFENGHLDSVSLGVGFSFF